jgi:hypothetical protein
MYTGVRLLNRAHYHESQPSMAGSLYVLRKAAGGAWTENAELRMERDDAPMFVKLRWWLSRLVRGLG